MSGNDSFTKILLHFDGTNGSTTITDNNVGGAAHTWTNHTGSIATAQSKFGGASYNCGAAAGFVDTPDHADFDLGSGDFTIDCWFNRQGGDGTLRSLFGKQTGVNIEYLNQLTAGNVLFFSVTTDGTVGTLVSVTGTTAITTTGMHHAAFVRTGNILKLFLDGVQEGGDVAFSGTVFHGTNALTVGCQQNAGSQIWNGFIDEFRLSVGVARWTSNFTPPASAYSFSPSQAVNVTCTTSVSVKKAVAKAIAVTCTTATSFLRAVSKIVAVTSAGAVTVRKAISHSLAISSTTATNVKKTVGKLISTASTTTTALSRRTGKIVAATLSGGVTFSRFIGKTVAITAHGAVAVNKLIPLTVNVAVSVTAHIIRLFQARLLIAKVRALLFGASGKATLTADSGRVNLTSTSGKADLDAAD